MASMVAFDVVSPLFVSSNLLDFINFIYPWW